MDSGLETALVSASIAAVVSLSVAIFSPLLTHHLWKRQKRKERKLAIAERYAVLNAEIEAYLVTEDIAGRGRHSAATNKAFGILFVVPVLFEKKEVVSRAEALMSVRNPETITMQRMELEAYMFAEALDLSFNKITTLPVR